MAAAMRRVTLDGIKSLLFTKSYQFAAISQRFQSSVETESSYDKNELIRKDKHRGVFVTAVKTGTTTAELTKAFSAFGNVDRIHRPLGNGGKHIDLEFDTSDTVKSISEEFNFLDSIEIRDDKTVRVRNVTKDIDKDHVKGYFSKYGQISACTEQQNYKNYCFVFFKDRESVESAVEKRAVEVHGRKVSVQRITK